LVGDPILVLAPLFFLIALMLLAFALEAPAGPEILVPLVSLPPVDAFTDVGIIGLHDRGTAVTWILRAVALIVRTGVFGIIATLAVQRARGVLPSLGGAARTVWERVRSFGFMELASFAVFGVTLSLGADLASPRDDGAIGTALLFGVAVLAGGFIAAADGLAGGAAFRRGMRWIRRRPLGHLALVALYGFASNGLFRLAAIGEPGKPRALPMMLYAALSALLTMWAVLAFARRHVLLYAEDAPRPG